jgi:hypothetical protein
VKESDKSTNIYLTIEELQGLYDMELTGTDEQVRDIFLIGCFIGQRVSDYGRIEPEWVGTTRNGVRVIRLQQKKTGHNVCVPIVGNQLETLLKKYNYRVPKISEAEINRRIKDICERLSVSIPSLAVKEKTMLKKHEKNALYTNKDGGRKLFEINAKGECIKPQILHFFQCSLVIMREGYISKTRGRMRRVGAWKKFLIFEWLLFTPSIYCPH